MDIEQTADMEFLERGEFELLTVMERFNIMYNYYTLEEKGLYLDPDFWSKLAHRVNADPELCDLPHVTGTVIEDVVGFCLTLGSDLMTYDEKFFRNYGEYYDDYSVPPLEEDASVVDEEED